MGIPSALTALALPSSVVGSTNSLADDSHWRSCSMLLVGLVFAGLWHREGAPSKGDFGTELRSTFP